MKLDLIFDNKFENLILDFQTYKIRENRRDRIEQEARRIKAIIDEEKLLQKCKNIYFAKKLMEKVGL